VLQFVFITTYKTGSVVNTGSFIEKSSEPDKMEHNKYINDEYTCFYCHTSYEKGNNCRFFIRFIIFSPERLKKKNHDIM